MGVFGFDALAPVDPTAMVQIRTPRGMRMVPKFLADRLAQPPPLPAPSVFDAQDPQATLESYLRLAQGASPDLAQRWAANIIANPNSPDRPLLDKAMAHATIATPDKAQMAAMNAEAMQRMENAERQKIALWRAEYQKNMAAKQSAINASKRPEQLLEENESTADYNQRTLRAYADQKRFDEEAATKPWTDAPFVMPAPTVTAPAVPVSPQVKQVAPLLLASRMGGG